MVLDPFVSNWLEPGSGLDVKVLPTWVEAEPLDLDRCPEPKAVLMIGTSTVPDQAWNEAFLALQWIGWDHPDLRFLTCGRLPLAQSKATRSWS